MNYPPPVMIFPLRVAIPDSTRAFFITTSTKPAAEATFYHAYSLSQPHEAFYFGLKRTSRPNHHSLSAS